MNTRYRTGQERFYDKYPEYPRIERSEEEFLGIGAMVILPILKKDISQKKPIAKHL